MLFGIYLVFINTLYMVLFGGLTFFLMSGRLTMSFTPRSAKTRYETSDERVEEHETKLSPLELERLADMAEFDARISMLKDEVASANLPDARRESRIVAEESEGVQNLPHNAIYIAKKSHQLEIAD